MVRQANAMTFTDLTACRPPVAQERRRSARHPHVTMAKLSRLDGGAAPEAEAMVLNVSLHGVGLRTTAAFPEGGLYLVEIGTGPLHLVARMKVVGSRLRGDGTWDVGCEFSEG